MTESRELAFPACPSASCLQAPNTSARDTRRGVYAGNFCVNGRFSRPVLPLLAYRPPLLVRVALDGGCMLATSARTTDACTAPLVAKTGFQTKGTGTATAGYLCMTSSHRLLSLQSSLSRPVLPLLGCRPPMPVRVGQEGGRMLATSARMEDFPGPSFLFLPAGPQY